jgi:regulator of sigma E protease
MTAIISFLQSSVAYAVPMIVLLGLLIFFHELGHFLVAKYFKVRVEVFSLGFGPKILKFKKGDTVYAISALPLGGYVKMFGDDPTAEVDSEHRAVSLTHKPVGQRIAIVLAGPLMNFFLAIVLFAGVALIGEPALAPKLGDVEAKSAAFSAGFRSGDTVKTADSKPVKSWDEFQKIIESHGDAVVPVTVARATGEEETLQVTPKQSVNKNVMSWDRHVGEIDGLSYASRSTLVGVRDANSIAGKAGFKTADMITSVNGEKMTKWRELRASFSKLVGSKAPVAIEIERGLLDENRQDTKGDGSGEVVKLELTIPADAKSFEEILAKVGLEYPELYLAGIEKNSPAAKAGLQKGDRLLSIDGKELASFEQIAGLIRAYGQNSKVEEGQEPKPLSVTAERDGKPLTVAIAPNMKERMSQNGKEEKRFEIGIRPMIVDAAPSTFEMTSSGIDAIGRGFNQTMKWSSLTILGFVRMFQAEVSAKNIGGFLSIGQMAKKSWAMGPSQFLNIMAIISINLFILNLLPVPVLDGGHLVFYSIEALRGAPLSMRKMEIAQQVGLVLLLGLMVFALFNDVTRILN